MGGGPGRAGLQLNRAGPLEDWAGPPNAVWAAGLGRREQSWFGLSLWASCGCWGRVAGSWHRGAEGREFREGVSELRAKSVRELRANRESVSCGVFRTSSGG
ncbi:hypothetical protein CRG98_001850 [Punica granatum]|uniref:Uncharacterized protein n=1 Tax=Punica granatum TaxID=22663 RepID=A0A2I0LBZ8_PUNGR|nr:hypothetical protein CRG98_001850 [Punica granatum]